MTRGPARPPRAGYQGTDAEGDPPRRDVAALAQAMRELVPPELERRLADALRELLLALRALIDWYLERAEGRAGEPTEVEDIPID